VNAGFTLARGNPGTDILPQHLGAQNETILEELGYNAEEIAMLSEQNVI
jgi:crotonobetainyl-CoA:carnitine CoA-transferase CaiB-like acyl-CoA transferase